MNQQTNMLCKYCGSPSIVKYGTFNGIQRYWCNDCKRKFADNRALPKMKTDTRIISAALSCYFGGMPLDAVQRHLHQQFGIYYSEMGIYNWVKRFSKEAVEQTKDFKPVVGDTWIADETMLKVGGKKVWFFDVIDEETRYLLASRLAKSRTIKEAALVMHEAKMYRSHCQTERFIIHHPHITLPISATIRAQKATTANRTCKLFVNLKVESNSSWRFQAL